MYNILKKRRRELDQDKAAQKPEPTSPGLYKMRSAQISQTPDEKGRLVTRTHDETLGGSADSSYVGTDYDDVSVKAGDRLDRLKTSDKGPFLNEQKKPFVAPEPGGHGAEAEPVTGTPEPGISMSPRDHGDAAKHHMSLRDIYRKYTKPAQDTIPHTERINEEEKRELGPEIDMERPK